jgi:hypothetical protein
MTPETFIALRTAEFSPADQKALYRSQAGGERSYCLFNPDELARLRFTRWLAQSGRMAQPAPVSLETKALCTALVGTPIRPALEPSHRPIEKMRTSHYPAHVAAPRNWTAWAEKYGVLRADRVTSRA